MKHLIKTYIINNPVSLMQLFAPKCSEMINELEELAWRMAGRFDERDVETLKEMFSVARNKDHFDRQFYPQDMLSLEQFVSKINSYDDR